MTNSSLLPNPHRHAVNGMASRSSTLRGAKASFAAVFRHGASLIWSAASIAAFLYGFNSYYVKKTYLTVQFTALIKANSVADSMRYKKAAVPAALQIWADLFT